MSEAASVCLSRFHEPPTVLETTHRQSTRWLSTSWTEPSPQLRGAWANEIDATEIGACGVAIAAVEHLTGLRVVSRAAHGSGADYRLSSREPTDDDGELDLEEALRLEVGGTSARSREGVWALASDKVKQIRRVPGPSGIAVAVGFKERLVVIRDA